MATKRIYQISKEFECDEKKIIEFLTGQGIKVANRLSAVSEETYNLLKTTLFAPPPPEPEPEPPKVEEPAPVAVAQTEETPAPVQGGGKKKKKKKKFQLSAEQAEDGEDQELKTQPIVEMENVNAATQATCVAALMTGNDFIGNYVPFSKRKNKALKTSLSRNMDVWGLLQYLNFDSPDSSPIRYWQAVNKLTTAAYKLLQEYGLKNRKTLGEIREKIKPVGEKYEPQEIFTDEENQKFATQQRFLFNAFGHGMGTVNDNLYYLKIYAERKKAYCEHMSFVDYLTNPEGKLETKIPLPFEVLAETIAYSINSIPCHVEFYLKNEKYIIKSIKNFFEWIDGYKKLKEQGSDATKLEKYLYLEEKFFNLIEFMSFDNLLYNKRSKDDSPFNNVLDLLNEYRDNMDDPDAERNFKYKVRGVSNIIYKPKEYIFLFKFADLDPSKDYRSAEEIAAALAKKESPAEKSDEA